MEFKKASTEHSEGINDLVTATYKNYPKSDFSHERIRGEIDSWVIAVEEDRVLGAAKISKRFNNGYLESLCVDKSLRGQGIGFKLGVFRKEEALKKFEVIYGSCRCTDSGIGSVIVKEKMGFSPVGFQPNRVYFGDQAESLVIEQFTRSCEGRTYNVPAAVLKLGEVVLRDSLIDREWITQRGEDKSKPSKELSVRTKSKNGEVYYVEVSHTDGRSSSDVQGVIGLDQRSAVDYIQINVSATNSPLLFDLSNMGFIPVSYLPYFSQQGGRREDIVEMVQLSNKFISPDITSLPLPNRVREIATYVCRSIKNG